MGSSGSVLRGTVDLGLDDALDRVVVHAGVAGGGEGGVEVGADRAAASGFGERVAVPQLAMKRSRPLASVGVLLGVTAAQHSDRG